jgi:hypothetical protein
MIPAKSHDRGWGAGDYRITWYVPGDNSAGTHNRSAADGYSVENNGPRTDPHVIFDCYTDVILIPLCKYVEHSFANYTGIVIPRDDRHVRPKHYL